MSASLCTHSFYDEIFNFTDVERTLKLMYICLTMQMFVWQKKQGGKYQMTDRWRLTLIKGSFTVSVKYITNSKTHDDVHIISIYRPIW